MEMRFPLILDGATGTQLQKRGYQGDVSAEQWVLDHPDSIQDIQRRYVQAGSRVVYAPTFGANRQKLEERGIFNQTAEYNHRLVALSRQAVDTRAWVAGDISPTGLFLAPLGEASFEELVDIYAEQAAGLEQAGVDLFVVETMMTLADARAAVLAIRSVIDRPIFVTFTCDESGRCLSGTDVAAALVVLQGMGVSAFGLNCSTGPEQMLKQLRRLRDEPPFRDILVLTASGPDEAGVLRVCTRLRQFLERELPKLPDQSFRLLGPAPAVIARVNNRYRYRLTLVGQDSRPLRSLIAALLRAVRQDRESRGTSVFADLNPMD